jgi:hypothetical protein
MDPEQAKKAAEDLAKATAELTKAQAAFDAAVAEIDSAIGAVKKLRPSAGAQQDATTLYNRPALGMGYLLGAPREKDANEQLKGLVDLYRGEETAIDKARQHLGGVLVRLSDKSSALLVVVGLLIAVVTVLIERRDVESWMNGVFAGLMIALLFVSALLIVNIRVVSWKDESKYYGDAGYLAALLKLFTWRARILMAAMYVTLLALIVVAVVILVLLLAPDKIGIAKVFADFAKVPA